MINDQPVETAGEQIVRNLFDLLHSHYKEFIKQPTEKCKSARATKIKKRSRGHVISHNSADVI